MNDEQRRFHPPDPFISVEAAHEHWPGPLLTINIKRFGLEQTLPKLKLVD